MYMKKCFVALLLHLLVSVISGDEVCVHYCAAALTECFNFDHFPTSKNYTEILDLGGKRNKFEILKDGEVIAANFTNLQKLRLSKCEIREIHLDTFKGCTNVTKLDLNDNHLADLNLNVFLDLPNLETLSLSSNPLKLFSKVFPKMILKELSLSFINLQTIHLDLFKNLEQLQTLDLVGNLLKTVDWKVFRPLKNLEIVLLQLNPFHCDCHVNFLLNYFAKRSIIWKVDTMITSCATLVIGAHFSHTSIIRTQLDQLDHELLVCPPQVTSVCSSKKYADGQYFLSVECEYKGYPKPEVTWTFDGKPLRFDHTSSIHNEVDAENEDFNYLFKQTGTILRTSKFFKNNGTRIKCEVTNVGGSESRMVDLPYLDMKDVSYPLTYCSAIRKSQINWNTLSQNLSFLDAVASTALSINLTTTTTSKTFDFDTQSSLHIIIAVLVLTVAFLLMGITGTGIYVAVRYSKSKRTALPKEIYSTLPRQQNQSHNATQRCRNMEDPPYPPLLSNGQENIYEICRVGSKRHFYETPLVHQSTLRPTISH